MSVDLRRVEPALWLLQLWALSQFGADAAYAVSSLDGSFRFGSPIFVGWLLSFVFLGAAALHPGMAELSAPQRDGAPTDSRRIVALAFAALVIPAVLVVQVVVGGERYVLLGQFASAAMFLLVLVRTAGLATRVTRGEQEQQRLREGQERLFQVLDGVPVGVYVRDAAGNPVFANGAAVALLGYGAEAVSPAASVLNHVYLPGSSEVAPRDRMPSVRALAGEVSVLDVDYRPPGRAHRRIRVHGTPIHDNDGVLLYGMVAMVDLTAEWESSTALERQRVELERSNAELERFAYVASHDLQEPLRMVASYVQLLARRYEGQLDEDADEFIGFAVGGAQRMQALIDDLLAYSRLGRTDSATTLVDLDEVVDDVVQTLRLALEDAGGEVRRSPLPTVRANRRQMEQLFQNLIGNALKFRGAERPVVEVGAERRDGDWVVHVADNGIGIEPQYGERIFNVFQRLHARDQYSGTGIGLAICKRVVELQGGEIWVEPNEPSGSNFQFSIPAAEG